MEKIFSVAGFFNHVARGFVYLPSLQRLPFQNASQNQLDSFVARLANGAKYLCKFLRRLCPEITNPRNVVIDAAWDIAFCPDIKQQQVAFFDRSGTIRRWTIMRITGE